VPPGTTPGRAEDTSGVDPNVLGTAATITARALDMLPRVALFNSQASN